MHGKLKSLVPAIFAGGIGLLVGISSQPNTRENDNERPIVLTESDASVDRGPGPICNHTDDFRARMNRVLTPLAKIGNAQCSVRQESCDDLRHAILAVGMPIIRENICSDVNCFKTQYQLQGLEGAIISAGTTVVLAVCPRIHSQCAMPSNGQGFSRGVEQIRDQISELIAPCTGN